jgi:dienelactone hydrolase
MLFRSDRLLDMLLYETLHPTMPVDDNIRDFSRDDESRGIYAMVPNGFEHIGRYSSNPEKSSETVEHTSVYFVP